MVNPKLPHLTVDAAVIWALYKEQPLTFVQLAEKVMEYTGRKHEAKKWRHLKERVIPGLKEEWKILRELEFKGEKCYALSDFTLQEEQIMKVLAEWQEEFKDKPYIRPLKIEELVYRVGKDPESRAAKSEVREVAIKLGWSPFQKELLEHSKKDLKDALEKWLRHLEPSKGKIYVGSLEDFYGLGRLTIVGSEVNVSPPEEPDTENFKLLKQHLEKGGLEILNWWSQLCNDAYEFLNLAKGLAEKIVESVKGKAGELMLPLGGDISKECVLVGNCVFLIYKSLKGEKVLDPWKDIKVEPRGNLYVVEPGPLCATYERRKAEDFAEFIRQQIRSEEYREDMKGLNEKREKLTKKNESKKDIESFKESIGELMGKIDDGFYLKGSCEKCKHKSRTYLLKHHL